VLNETLPNGFGYEWTDLTFQQKSAGDTALLVFPVCVMLVFLILSAQYESWALPLAVILIVPMCLLSAMVGVWLKGSDNNVLTQIGFIVLVGLACKNAILIVEFARERVEHGLAPLDAAIEACRLRLRPILMTSFAFIMGVVPLVTAAGAGSEMRQAIGIAVFAGMLGVTAFGLFLTPVFFVTIEAVLEKRRMKRLALPARCPPPRSRPMSKRTGARGTPGQRTLLAPPAPWGRTIIARRRRWMLTSPTRRARVRREQRGREVLGEFPGPAAELFGRRCASPQQGPRRGGRQSARGPCRETTGGIRSISHDYLHLRLHAQPLRRGTAARCRSA
jgi:hypothetical protein